MKHMKKLLQLIVLIMLLQPLHANSYSPQIEANIYETAGSYLKLKKAKPAKISLKQRLLIKFAERKLRRQINEDKQRKTAKLFGTLSLLLGIVGIVSWIIGAAAVLNTPILLAFLLFFPLALIFGITSLLKRKRLSDKKQISKIPAILGIIIGGAGVLAFIVGIIIFLSTPFF